MEFFEKAIWPNIPACEANSAGGGGNICVDRAYTVKIFIFFGFFCCNRRFSVYILHQNRRLILYY